MLVGAIEVLFSLDGAVVFSLGLIEDDADPFSSREFGQSDVGHLAQKVLLLDLDP